MKRIKYNNSDIFFNVIGAPKISRNTIEIHYEEYDKPNIGGFKIYSGLNGDVETKDCSEYTTVWNVLTPLTNGVVYSMDGSVETEDNRLYVPSQEEIEAVNKEIESQALKDLINISEESRLTDVENAICELYEMLEGKHGKDLF